ncbi:response regulator transcription factor [uncultured Sphingomonas sp.]|uniref:response regulator transcription factor n=1 Tax=uncultured Sphingomonas sp. TaxID=158754 RepID=UPI0025DAFC84|nr:response regulator transcription factor [uncultured Sphingomonas sp.]
MSHRILLVEDDPRLREQLANQLVAFGHTVTAAADGPAGLSFLATGAFDIVVLDWMLPTLDGLSLLREVRSRGLRIPVLMLTALGQTIDKVEVLDAGADDYVVKPCDPLELNARIKALLRARSPGEQPADTIEVGDIVISPAGARAWRKGQSLGLSQIEFRMLLELARLAGDTVTRAMLVERVWGRDLVTTSNVIEAHIRHLRMKLCRYGDDPIETVRGAGYSLRR